MPQFPNKEAEIVALAEQMIAGLTEHGADFPSVTKAALESGLADYKEQKQTQDSAKSQAQIATISKDENLDLLVELMKNDLKKAEVDCTNIPQNLYEIGWGPRSEPQPLIAPASPTELHPIAEGQGTIWLVWNKPETGGPVRNYIIERRQQPQSGGDFGPWTLVNTTYNREINLTDQPVNARLEYRAKAANAAGESLPSNSVSVVLP
jgi:hypothetical protein